jgi:hypothetical protein
MRSLDAKAIDYAISVDMSPQLCECIAALPRGSLEARPGRDRRLREWAEFNYLPSDGIWRKDAVSPRRYLAISVRPYQGELLRDGAFLHRYQPFRLPRRQLSQLDPTPPPEGRYHRACP